ncbi:MAG TPA: hypothetical protein DCX25_02655 [Candidatus Pacebacteria bacterium]|nr:MAG: hypothetical protein UX00_C0004G0045 [Microgenomates group bacterium GW2011_GWB1_45_17]KKU23957.1 MAG: hypothetical protein UX35_C0003G0093 [Microgenomates group bacterium GW2011_GWA1_46_15]KKU24650.1 MAG: hypothetical protein UX36_C0001G0267 [Microgenomates group bacterium GW2011_GWC1_46_15]HAV15205.1 hypothetical protein [Candidatus Paceibacterota bacterium]HCR11085.1 hypothetical protein [Candidatus Paceibacterota bacterium]
MNENGEKNYYMLNGKPVAVMSDEDPFAATRAGKLDPKEKTPYRLGGQLVRRVDDGEIAYMSE